MKTILNDGVTVSGDPCGVCGGKLTLRNAPSGGFFLGCTNYASHGCTYKVEPCSEELDRMKAEKEARQRLARIVKLSKKSRIPCWHQERGLGFATQLKRGMKEAPIKFNGEKIVTPFEDIEWLEFGEEDGKAIIVNPISGEVVKRF